MYIFRHNAIAHLTDYNSIYFYVQQENKKFMWLTLLWYSLYCSGLEPNLKYLKGIPDLPKGTGNDYEHTAGIQ